MSSDWMLGTFSNRRVGESYIGLTSFGHYDFREDGTLALIGISKCAENYTKLLEVLNWSRAGDSLVIVETPEGSAFEEWRVTPGGDCNTLQLDKIQDGKPIPQFPLYRGAVCMRELPPCPSGTSCEGCETVWCDEPPPPCGE